VSSQELREALRRTPIVAITRGIHASDVPQSMGATFVCATYSAGTPHNLTQTLELVTILLHVSKKICSLRAECCVPAEHLIFYIDFNHRITDIVADEASDLAMPADRQLGMDWRDIPGIPPDRLTVVSEAMNRCIIAGGIHFCDFWADLPSGHRKYRLKLQRNARETHVVVHMTLLDRRRSQRRLANFRGGRRVTDIDFRQLIGPTHVCPSQIAKAIGVDSKTIRREIRAGELQACRVHRDWKIPYPIARAYVLRMTASLS
jgi:hypothetical protein